MICIPIRRKSLRRLLPPWGFMAIWLSVVPLTVAASEFERKLDTLKEQMAELTHSVMQLRGRVAEIEKAGAADSILEEAYASVAPQAILTCKAAGASRPRFEGDCRYRVETIRIADTPARDRQRFRGGFRARITLSETVPVGLGPSSGGVSPGSGTQVFDDGVSNQDVDFDQVFLSWRVPVRGVSTIAGKMDNPFSRIGGYDLLWDDELFPQSLPVAEEHDQWFVSVAEFLFEERASSADVWLLGVQPSRRFDVDSKISVTAEVGWFDDCDVEGRASLFDRADSEDNLLDAVGHYASDFDQFEVFLEPRSTRAANFPLRGCRDKHCGRS